MGSDKPEIDEIFLAAVEKPVVERVAFLDEVCGENFELKARIERLLNAQSQVASFLDSPAPELGVPTDIRPLTEQPGDVIGPYKLLQQIGEGGMGVVYMAEQTEPVERRVALKIIKPGMDTQQVIARFEAERQALAMMDHPNIAKVLDAGTTDSGRPFFVMELVKGVSVTEYCDQQHLTPRERLELFIPICQAVQHAHQKGIIHRDLKPSNILITQFDDKAVPKVIDFGVAKAISHKLTEKTMFTQHGQIVGTLEYMSPEQAQLNQMDVDTRSDIYSLGVLLYELLVGETPFDKQRLRSAAFDELLRIIREEEPPMPSTRLSTSQTLASIAANRKTEPKRLSLLVRGELDWIVMKALEKDRTRRYETASKFAEDVLHYLNDEAVVACPPSAGYRFRKFARRNKAVIGTTAAIVVALLVGIAGTTWQAIRATAEAKRADEEAANAKTKTEIAQAVNEFLNHDLLGMADATTQFEAGLTPNPNIKLRTVLDRAAEKIEGRFKDQPLVEASIRNTIGVSYISVGEYEQAEKYLKGAEQLFREVRGIEDPDTLEVMRNLAIVYRSQGRLTEAETLYLKTLEIRLRTLGGEHSLTLESMNSLGLVYLDQGHYAEAEKLHLKTLGIRQLRFGSEHPDTLESMTSLGMVYFSQGRYADAQQLSKDTLQLKKRVLGDRHPATLSSMNNLALVYMSLGRYEAAEELNLKTLEIKEKLLGHEHPDTLDVQNNLAIVFQRQGRYEDAEMLHRKTLEIRLRVLGKENPDTLKSMANLANVFRDQARYTEAEKLHRETLDIRLRLWGKENPDTLTSMASLASIYHDQAHYTDAEQLQKEILHIRRRLLGKEHSNTLATMHNLALIYHDQFRLVEAEKLLQRTLDLQRQTLGHEHPTTLNCENSLASVFHAQGRWDEAMERYKEILEIQRRILGKEHPETLLSMANLANTFAEQGRIADAEQLSRETLAIQRRTLGETHPDTLHSLNNLAIVYMRQARYSEAETLLQQALDGRRVTLGDHHPLTLETVNDLANVFRGQGRSAEAEQLHRHTLQIRKRIQGDEHPRTLSSRANLALCLMDQGQLNAAEAELRRVWEIRRRVLGPEHPETIHSMLNLGTCLSRQSKIQEAIEIERHALELAAREWGAEHPDTLSLINNLGVALLKIGQYSESGELLVRVLEVRLATLDPGNPHIRDSAHNLINVIWHLCNSKDLSQRNPQLALKCARAVVKAESNNANHWDNLGVALCRNQLWDEAVQTLEKARKMRGGNDPEHAFFLAMAYWKSGQRELSMETFSAAQLHWENRVWRADHEQRRFWAEAQSVIPADELQAFFTNKIDSSPDGPEAGNWYRARGLFHERHSHFDEAAADYEQFLHYRSGDTVWYSPRSKFLLNLAHREQVYSALMRARPQDRHLKVARGRYLGLCSRWSEALEAFRPIPATSKLDSEQCFEIACLLLLNHDRPGYDQFLASWIREVGQTDNPWETSVLARTVCLVPQTKELVDRAVRWAEMAVEIDRKPWHLNVLGLSLYRAGRYEEATQALQESESMGWVPEGHPQNWIALGLADHKLGNSIRSEDWLTRADAWLTETVEKWAGQSVHLQITDWLALNIVHREAHELLRKYKLTEPLIAPKPIITNGVLATQTITED